MHTNKINGKKYIGITSTTVERRWKNGYGYSRELPIGRAIEKYGWDNFEHTILYNNLSESEAKSIEVDLIKRWNTQNSMCGYNICAGGEGATGWHPSEETKNKISLAASKRVGELNSNYAHYWSERQKKKYGEAHKRENLSDYTISLMSQAAQKRTGKHNPFYGHHHTEETKCKIAQKHCHPVKQYSIDGDLLHEYNSIKEAAQITGIHKTAISRCCAGASKTSGGYKWQYAG